MAPSTRLIASILISIGLLLGPASTPQAQADQGAARESTRLAIRFQEGTTGQRMAELHRRAGVTVVDMIPELDTYVVDTGKGTKWLRSLVYRASNAVEHVEDDLVATLADTPDDTYYDDLRQWGLFQIGAESAWDVTHSNADVRIAILDTGIDSDHPDLAAKIVAAADFTGSGSPEPVSNSHGTHVAGIAAAITDNATGVAGLAWDATLINAKVMSESGTGYYSWIANGIIWATDSGADVINMSLAGGGGSYTLANAIDYAWDNGVVIVAAAGNDGSSSPRYPAAYDRVISVAASTSTEELASWSNYGASWVDVSAPSWAYSTKIGGYTTMQGTSMACPVVAGLAGLVFDVATDSSGDGRTNDEVRLAIESTSIDTGIDVKYGRIDAAAAVGTSPPPTTGQVTGTVIDAGTSTPIEGATVSDGSRTHVTDSQGVYTLSGVPAGTYTVTADADGYIQGAREVSVTAGETTTADFALEADPVPNSPPILDPVGNKSVDEDQLLEFSVTATDADDDPLIYEAAVLPTGATFVDQGFSWMPFDGQDGTYEVTFTVSDGEDTDSETISITVNAIDRIGSLSGTVTDASTGEPLEGTTISLDQMQTVTASDGSYLIADVAQGEYVVMATADDYYGTETATWIAQNETSVVDFALEPVPNRAPVLDPIGDKTVEEAGTLQFTVSALDPDGDPLEYDVSGLPSGATFVEQVFSWTPSYSQAGTYGVEFLVSDGELSDAETIAVEVTDQPATGSVSGTVCDAVSGLPVAGVTIVAGETEDVTDVEGAFLLEQVPEGTARLRLSAERHEDATLDVTVVPGQTTSIDVQLIPFATIAGVVSNELTGEPVEAAVIAADGSPACVSSATGTYELHLAAGEYSLTIVVEDYEGHSEDVVVQVAETIEINVCLIPVVAHTAAASGPDARPGTDHGGQT